MAKVQHKADFPAATIVICNAVNINVQQLKTDAANSPRDLKLRYTD
jgi:hypothetical protein